MVKYAQPIDNMNEIKVNAISFAVPAKWIVFCKTPANIEKVHNIEANVKKR